MWVSLSFWAEVAEDHLSILKNAVQRCNCAYECIYANACAYRQKTDGEVTADFVLSLTLTAQTKTKSHKLHNALFFFLLALILSVKCRNIWIEWRQRGGEGFKHKRRPLVTSAWKREWMRGEAGLKTVQQVPAHPYKITCKTPSRMMKLAILFLVIFESPPLFKKIHFLIVWSENFCSFGCDCS